MRFLFVILVLLTSGCLLRSGVSITTLPPIKESKLAIDFFSVPKNVYHSNENMNVTLVVRSPSNFENATLKIYGIYSRRYRLNETVQFNLSKGVKIVSFDYTTPSCFGCAGIQPGEYNITAELLVGGKIVDNKTIEVLVQS